MKRSISLSCLLSAGLLLTACQTQTVIPDLLKSKMTNGQIVEDIRVADQGELAASKIAQKRAVGKTVRHYANYLHNEHASCSRKFSHFSKTAHIKPESSQYANEIQSYYAKEVDTLKAANRHDFDKTYINAVIQDHQHALEFIDRSVKDSTNHQLTTMLKKAHCTIAAHLAKAQRIKKQMGY